jgi:uncharacterized protein (DUF1800 family)
MASLSPLQGALGHRRAAHLLRRASFRYTKPTIDDLALKTAGQAVNELVKIQAPQLTQPGYADPATPGSQPVEWILPPGLPSAVANGQDFLLRQYVLGWWLNEAIHDKGIGHKMMFFYHQNFVTTFQTSQTPFYFDYLSLLRFYALGNFKKLALKMVTDNVMLSYLNNAQNSVGNPNENFAREFFELFTIGKGPEIAPGDYTNYTEQDIVEAARLLTGWRLSLRSTSTIDPETGIVAGRPVIGQHDKTAKTFSYHFNNQTIQGAQTAAAMTTELQQFVDMIFNQKETARHLVRRLYRYFVTRTISTEIENDIIEPLATSLQNGNYEVEPVLKTLLKSQHFYDADDSDNTNEIIGSMIKSPLELSFQAMTFFGMPIPDPITQNTIHHVRFYTGAVRNRMLSLAGMNIFSPSDVAGYPAYYQEPDFNRQWFNSSTIVARYKLPAMLLSGKYLIGGSANVDFGSKLDIAPWVKNSGVATNPRIADTLVTDLIKYLLPETPDSDRVTYYTNDILLDNLPATDWTYEWDNYVATGDDTEVTIGLEKLINAIMYSPEFQLF